MSDYSTDEDPNERESEAERRADGKAAMVRRRTTGKLMKMMKKRKMIMTANTPSSRV